MLKQYPFYIKSTVVLLGLTLLAYALFYMRDILVPVAFAILLAILLNPMTNWFMCKRLKKLPSITIAMILAFGLIIAVIYFLSSQIASFSGDLPVLEKKFNQLFGQFQHYLNNNFNISVSKQDSLLQEARTNLKPLLGETLGTVVGSLGIIFLVPIYTFLFLYYKTLILNFFYEVFDEPNSKEVELVLNATKGAVQSYMVGLLLEALVVAAMNTLALWLLGVKYALLIGVIGAILNMLPYIGGLIAISLPVVIATITKEGFDTQLGVIIAYIVIQFIDNNFLVPFIVSSKVRINALISLLVVFLGGAIWGIPGMFLSIPFIAVLKIIFDNVPELKPWGKLLGDKVPTRHKGEIWDRFRRMYPYMKKKIPNKEQEVSKLN